MRAHSIHIPIVFHMNRPHREKEARDPYDGLRPWSAITHGIGAGLALIGTMVLTAIAMKQDNWSLLMQFLIYGLSMTGLYTASTLYHCVNTSVPGRLALRKFDHCSIYLLIAGSYTPVCLTVLWEQGGMPMLAAIWILAAAGIGLTLSTLNIPRWLSSTIYLCMGWLAVFAIVPLYHDLPAEGFFWLLLGGILYSVGGVLYAVKWPGRNNPRFGCHEIFHVFILLGSICHYVMMLQTIAIY